MEFVLLQKNKGFSGLNGSSFTLDKIKIYLIQKKQSFSGSNGFSFTLDKFSFYIIQNTRRLFYSRKNKVCSGLNESLLTIGQDFLSKKKGWILYGPETDFPSKCKI